MANSSCHKARPVQSAREDRDDTALSHSDFPSPKHGSGTDNAEDSPAQSEDDEGDDQEDYEDEEGQDTDDEEGDDVDEEDGEDDLERDDVNDSAQDEGDGDSGNVTDATSTMNPDERIDIEMQDADFEDPVVP